MYGYRLVVVAGPDRGKEITVSDDQPTLEIGREREFLRCAADTYISRHHAEIETTPDGHHLIDCNSMNGSFHGRRRLDAEKPMALASGDRFGLGPETVVEFQLLEQPASNQPAKTPPSRLVSPPPSSGRKQARPAPPAPVVASPSPPREQFNGYAVYESLDESATDRVDRAVQERTREVVALKRFIASPLSRAAKKRIVDEARRAAQWQHPNIAHILDSGESDGVPYLASRFVDGVSLVRIHDSYRKQIDAALAAYIVREVCRAVGEAQAKDGAFTHRNLQHGSIVVGRAGEVVAINFGLPPTATMISSVPDLPHTLGRFLAPECDAGKPFERRADVYSLGVILYELLTQDEADTRGGVLPAIATIRPEVPPPLAQVAAKASNLHQLKRYQNANEMADALTAALDNLAPGYAAKDVGAWLAKFCPKN